MADQQKPEFPRLEIPRLTVEDLREAQENVDQFILNLTGKLSDIAEPLDQALSEAIRAIEEDVGQVVANILKGLLSAIINILAIASIPIGYGLAGFQSGQLLGEYAAKRVLRDKEIWIPSIRDLIDLRRRGIIGDIDLDRYMAFHGVSREWVQRLFQLTKTLITPDQIARAWRLGNIPTDMAFQLLRMHGYDDAQASLLLGLEYSPLSPSEAISLWLRKEISEQELDEYLKKAGILVRRERELLKKLAYIIPSPSDLIRMAVREAFNPEAIRTFQLDQDFPEEFAEWAEKQGLSREWAIRYWVAHWQLPSVTQALEMFHRTTTESTDPQADIITSPWGATRRNVIGRNTLRMLLKAQDISPFWRDKIEAISYAPLTRVDVRRAYDLGIIDENQVYFTYRDLGYNHENATILTQFTILDTISEERNRLRNELIELYEEGVLRKEELKQGLEALQFNPKTIEILLEYAEYRKERKRVERYKKIIKAQYMRGDISDEEMHDQLVRLGLEVEEVIRLQEEWQAEKIAKERTLSKGDIEAMYKKGILAEEEAIDRLIRYGYSEEDANYLIALWNQELIEAGAKAKPKERYLTKSDIKEAFILGLITEQQAREFLKKLRYSDQSINIIIELWKTELSP